ncbi:MAG: D-xylose ABC transporter ATP-binding protein [Firmicutes bacterium HGW-Firmicutes-7]|nr:MAG: D-xylose ABC transporter ATP-binding protein [Firmicutes bacterium HGW-Firmicutes-7]
MNDYILEMKNISKSFFGIKVLENAQLQVKPGEVHVLLGENGAGKSTLIKILSSAYKKEAGQIFVNGVEVDFKSPKEAIDNGVSVIYQEFNLNPHMAVYENIYLGKEHLRKGLINKKESIIESEKYMKLIGLNVSPTTLVSKLSVAEKQMVEIAKAITTDVKVLVLDEPTAAITDKETEKLFDIIRSLKAKGVGIIYISHRMSELVEIGDRCTIMRDGAFVSTVELKETSVDELTRLMVGRNVSFEKIENKFIDKDQVALRVENLSFKKLLKNINFEINKGEIFGLAGLVGAGRTELAKCIIGEYKTVGATIKIRDHLLKGNSVPETIKNKMVYLSEDRKDEGLITIHSVKENIALPNLLKFKKILLNDKKMINTTKEYINKLRIRTSSPLAEVKTLSGGNQQKVVIAKWLCLNADVYIFDEPTRGIDVGARDEIYAIMYELIKNGASIIMISSDLVEVMKMCDRVAVMKEGQFVTILENDEHLTQEIILTYALHGGNKNEEC